MPENMYLPLLYLCTKACSATTLGVAGFGVHFTLKDLKALYMCCHSESSTV